MTTDAAHLRSIARSGGLARIKKHGNPGTREGRVRGGLMSMKRQRVGGAFKRLRKVQKPKYSAQLAELMGIFSGDGHVGEYQASIVTSSETDAEHAGHARELLVRIFGVPVTLKRRPDRRAIVVTVSSKEICRLLASLGAVRGNKVRTQAPVPSWLVRKPLYRRAFIRGLFDTDGSVYTESKTHRGRTYTYICMVFTNRSIPLLDAFRTGLEVIGLRPTQKTKYAVFLRRRADVFAYFRLIGSSNPKHFRKVEAYRALNGGVA